MFRKILLLCILWAYACMPYAQLRTEQTPADFKLQGPVKSVEKYTYFAKVVDSGALVKGRDYQGRLYNTNYRFVFDSLGRITERGQRHLNTDHWFTFRYVYNEKGYRLQEYSGERPLRIYTYDTSDRVTEIRWPESEYRRTQPDPRDSFLYDPDGLLKSQWRYTDIGTGDMTRYGQVFIRDSTGRIREVQIWGSGYKYSQVYTYGSDSSLYIRAAFPEGMLKTPEYIARKLDSRGNEILEDVKYREGGPVSRKTVTEYNDRNEPVRILVTGPGYQELQEMRYVYDDRGNWIRMTVYVNGNPESIHERIIRYYS